MTSHFVARRRWFALINLLAILLVCGTLSIRINHFFSRPLAQCYDVVGGKTPLLALDIFIDRVIRSTLGGELSWVRTVSEPEAMRELAEFRPLMSPEYSIRFSDDLAGIYEYNVHFENGTVLHFALESHWPECPDYEITLEEMDNHILLRKVKDATEHYLPEKD